MLLIYNTVLWSSKEPNILAALNTRGHILEQQIGYFHFSLPFFIPLNTRADRWHHGQTLFSTLCYLNVLSNKAREWIDVVTCCFVSGFSLQSCTFSHQGCLWCHFGASHNPHVSVVKCFAMTWMSAERGWGPFQCNGKHPKPEVKKLFVCHPD